MNGNGTLTSDPQQQRGGEGGFDSGLIRDEMQVGVDFAGRNHTIPFSFLQNHKIIPACLQQVFCLHVAQAPPTFTVFLRSPKHLFHL